MTYRGKLTEVDGEAGRPWYVRHPFGREPDFGVTSVNYDLAELLARAVEPASETRVDNEGARV